MFYSNSVALQRDNYLSSIFWIGLGGGIGIFQNVLDSNLGWQVYSLSTFAPWLGLTIFVQLMGTLAILRYYRFKGYQTAFITGIISWVGSLCWYIAVFDLLTTRVLGGFQNLVYAAVLLSSVIYAAGLLFSRAGKRRWLRAAGFFTFLLGLILAFVFTVSLYSMNTDLNVTLGKTREWVSRLALLVPLFFILNFFAEIRRLEPGAPVKQHRILLMILVGIVGVFATFAIGNKLLVEHTNRENDQSKNVTEKARAIASRFDARSYTHLTDTIRYRLMKPPHYDSLKKYPIVVL
jgi:hypothetical protein